jgi:glycosyltransferase involved in cell wall biosynthesis
MKILHIYKAYYPDSMGGVEKFIDVLIMSLNSYGVTSKVLTLTRDKVESDIHISGYIVHKVPQNFEIASSPFSFRSISRFAELVKEVDLIHYHFTWPFADMMHFEIRVNKPTVVTYHSDIVKQRWLKVLYTPLMWLFLKNVDAVVATSPNYINSSKTLLKLKKKTNIIPIGLDKTYYPIVSTEKLKFWETQFGVKFFLFVGAMRYYKGLEFLIEAAKTIEVPIVIAGAEDDCGRYLKDKVKKENIKNVYFLDDISEQDKIALLILCYGIVFPSCLRSEAFGIFLLEGAMYGKPMISCEIGTGTTYINIHNKTGIVIPPCDALALQQAMQYLLDHPEKAAAMGENAQNRYSQLFTAAIMAKQYISLYQDIIKAHSEASA